jgi:hypothetical protein
LWGGARSQIGTHANVAATMQPPPGTPRQCGALHHATGQLPQPRENFFV